MNEKVQVLPSFMQLETTVSLQSQKSTWNGLIELPTLNTQY